MANIPVNALEMPTNDFSGKVELHFSDMYQFKGCRRAWNYGSKLRMSLEPRRLYAPFFFGRAVHNCMERSYAEDAAFSDSLPAFVDAELAKIKATGPLMAGDQRLADEQTELVAGLLDHYVQWEARQTGPYCVKELEFVSVEQEFKVPLWNPRTGEIHPNAFFAGKWDGIVRNKKGELYIWELKTARTVSQKVAQLPNDEQATYYLNAARYALGPDVKGMIYTIMAKRVPKMPTINKNGMLTTSVTNQSFDSYLRFIKLHHGEIATGEWISAHYGPTLIALYDAENTHFQRHIVIRNQHALDNGMENMYRVADEITRPDLQIYPSPGFNCGYCIFNRPCIAEQNGGNVSDILMNEYQLRSNDDEPEGLDGD